MKGENNIDKEPETKRIIEGKETKADRKIYEKTLRKVKEKLIKISKKEEKNQIKKQAKKLQKQETMQ